MLEIVRDTALCTGCSACAQICPQCAVSMKENDEGFAYPEIQTEKCTDCGLCRKTCPVNRALDQCPAANISADGSDPLLASACSTVDKPVNTEELSKKVSVFACCSNDEDIRKKSTSGGVFTHLASNVLKEGGAVFGAGFDENFRVCHFGVEDAAGLEGLRKSKYVQSDIGNTFKEAAACLKKGKKVLFCGTPCQIAGLKAFLGKENENLLTCDLACHGVPSPRIWRMFLDFLRVRYKGGIIGVSFRDKSTGWDSSSMVIAFENGRQYREKVKTEMFFMGFGKSIFNRRSCFSCRFRLQNSKADITLADFWGADKLGKKAFSGNKGVSLAVVHTEAGKAALSGIKDNVVMEERSLDEGLRGNPRLVSSVREPAGRMAFFDGLRSGYSFDRLRRKHMDNFSFKFKLKRFVRLILRGN